MQILDWQFRPRTYPHFDHTISNKGEAVTLINNFQRTGQHSFLPFLESPLELRRFSKYLERIRIIEAGGDGNDVVVRKDRPIKYASHRDSQLFSYYRTILANAYEAFLAKNGLSEHAIAYRKILLSPQSSNGKCNIHYAQEAFDEISRRGNCVAITLDIKGFFESLDHSFLEQKWCEVLGVVALPKDHAAIFKAVTDYKIVDKNACYEKLGLITIDGNKKKYLQCPIFIFENKKMLCDKQEYREKIVGAGLVKRNEYGGKLIPQGIPQGSPISDVLANIYLIEFDKEMSALAQSQGAYYRRYSDDILWICDPIDADQIRSAASDSINRQGNKTLIISGEKTTQTHFTKSDKGQLYTGHLFSYLGFSFDGHKALYRDKTISNYKRDVVFSIQSFVRRAKDKTNGNEAKNIKPNGKSLKQNLNISQIYHKVGFLNKSYISKQRDLKRTSSSTKVEGNFMTYHLRATKIFNDRPNAQYNLSDQQLKDYKKFIGQEILKEAKKYDSSFTL